MKEMIEFIAVVIGIILIIAGFVGIESTGELINQVNRSDVAMIMIGLGVFGIAAFKGWFDAEFLNH